MKLSKTFGSVLLTAQAATVMVQSQGDQIIGGTYVNGDAYPWLVSLQTSSGFHFCGASLIGPSTVLTAAHCVSNGQTNFQVEAGTSDLDSSRGVVRSPSRVYVHPSYDANNIRNDIAIVELSSPITTITPINWSSSTSASGTATIAGWGRTTGNGSGTRDLKEVTIPIVDNQTCRNSQSTYATYLTDSMICIGYSDGSKGSCNGDSGGPLFQGTTQLGLTSWGLQGCISYSVYTRLGSYASWIQGYIDQIEGGNGGGGGGGNDSCACVGSGAGLDVGETCGAWLNQNFNWCYSSTECPGSTASQRYDGYYWFECSTSRLDIAQQLETFKGNTIMPVDTAAEDFSAASSNDSGLGAGAFAGIGAAVAGVAAAGAFVVYKKQNDAKLEEVIARSEGHSAI